ncbi:MAG: hypothetical protein ACRDIE_00515, partial [Chloroflexota bacterium]
MQRRIFLVLGRFVPVLLILGSLLVASGGLVGSTPAGHAAPAAVDTDTPSATVSPTAEATISPTAVPSGPATLAVNPGQVLAGETVALTGKGYQGEESVALELDTTGAGAAGTPLGVVHAGGDGSFDITSLKIPASTPAGNYTIVGRGLTSTKIAQTPLVVTAPKATLTVTPTTFTPDDSIKVSGTNFLPGEVVTIALAATSGSTSITLGQAHADTSGNIGPATIQIPFGVTSGSLQVVATGQSSNRVATVGVTVHAPAAGLVISPTSAKPNQTIAVTGTHFQPGEPVTIDLVTLSATSRVGNVV